MYLSACFDCLYLITNFCDNLTRFLLADEESKPEWYSVLYPYVIYPLSHGTVLLTVYTVVVLSFERLHAICSPLTHEPYFWPYFLMVLSSPITLVVPIFFHYHLDYDQVGNIKGSVKIVTEFHCVRGKIFGFYKLLGTKYFLISCKMI